MMLFFIIKLWCMMSIRPSKAEFGSPQVPDASKLQMDFPYSFRRHRIDINLNRPFVIWSSQVPGRIWIQLKGLSLPRSLLPHSFLVISQSKSDKAPPPSRFHAPVQLYCYAHPRFTRKSARRETDKTLRCGAGRSLHEW